VKKIAYITTLKYFKYTLVLAPFAIILTIISFMYAKEWFSYLTTIGAMLCIIFTGASIVSPDDKSDDAFRHVIFKTDLSVSDKETERDKK
jgi:hypothetical protein